MLHDVLVSRILHLLLVLGCPSKGPADLLGALEQVVGPLVQRRVGGHGAVVGDGGQDVDDLEPPTGGQVLHALLEEARPVGEGDGHEARVDVVEGLAEGPVVLEVVDLELDVGGHEAGLDGAQVDADDGGRGVVVSEVDGPAARARADVEDAAEGLLVEGRKVQPVVKGEEAEGVLEVEALLLGLVVGRDVGAVLVRVVRPAVLHAELVDGAAEGRRRALDVVGAGVGGLIADGALFLGLEVAGGIGR